MNYHVDDKIKLVLQTTCDFNDALRQILPLQETDLRAMNFRDLLTLYNAIIGVPDIGDLLLKTLSPYADHAVLEQIVGHIVLYELFDDPFLETVRATFEQYGLATPAKLTEWDLRKMLLQPLIQVLHSKHEQCQDKDLCDAFFILVALQEKTANKCQGLCYNKTENGNLFCSQHCWSLYHMLHHV